jgi:hypothetical protein
MEFVWRFGKKWSTRMQYFSASRQEQAVLEEDIEWGDELIQAGSSVVTGTDFEVTRVFFARSFDRSAQFDYGAGLGIHWLETGAFIEYDILTTFGERSAVSASGPLPNIGTWYYYSPSEKWYLGGRVDWFDATIGDFSGGIANVAAGVNYRLFDHVGVGLKYQLFGLDVEVDNSGWRGGADLVYQGWYVYLSGHWK